SLFRPAAPDESKCHFLRPRYLGGGATDNAVVRGASLFNMGSRSTDTNSYALQFMIYDTWPNSGNGHSVLAKRARMNNGPGWNIRMHSQGGNVAVVHEGDNGGGGYNWYRIRKGNQWRMYSYVYKVCGDRDSLI